MYDTIAFTNTTDGSSRGRGKNPPSRFAFGSKEARHDGRFARSHIEMKPVTQEAGTHTLEGGPVFANEVKGCRNNRDGKVVDPHRTHDRGHQGH